MDKREELDEALDFDSEIQHDGGAFDVLPEGDEVRFTVRRVDKGLNKDGTFQQVKLELLCESLSGHGRTTVNDFVTLSRKSEWKLCEIFTALGLRRHGDRLKMRWDIEGMTGRGTVSVEKYTKRDGSEGVGNRMRRYLEPRPRAEVTSAAGGADDLSLV